MKSKSYPPETNAFLYYFMSSEKPRIAGELRLRVTSSNDVALFESGSDLLRPDGQIWFRPLHNLSKFYPPLYEKLWEDQLIPDDLDRVLATLSSRRYSYSRSHFLYTLNDTFILDFSRRQHVFSTITEQGVHRLPFNYIFFDRRDISNKRPYRGAYTSHHLLKLIINIYIDYSHEFLGNALVRLERSSLPDHKGTRTVVLRFLKIITPVKCVIPQYDGYISCPKEGELYQRRHARSKASQNVWSVNIDELDGPTSPGPGLRLLWDA